MYIPMSVVRLLENRSISIQCYSFTDSFLNVALTDGNESSKDELTPIRRQYSVLNDQLISAKF
jgi:hypothetical protein